MFSVTPLSFESAQYRGSIVDNSLQLSPLVLSQGYEGVTVSVEVVGGKYTLNYYYTGAYVYNDRRAGLSNFAASLRIYIN